MEAPHETGVTDACLRGQTQNRPGRNLIARRCITGVPPHHAPVQGRSITTSNGSSSRHSVAERLTGHRLPSQCGALGRQRWNGRPLRSHCVSLLLAWCCFSAWRPRCCRRARKSSRRARGGGCCFCCCSGCGCCFRCCSGGGGVVAGGSSRPLRLAVPPASSNSVRRRAAASSDRVRSSRRCAASVAVTVAAADLDRCGCAPAPPPAPLPPPDFATLPLLG